MVIRNTLSTEFLQISEESRAELIERWFVEYGNPPPKGISRRLLEYSAAYKVQVKNLGGLRPETKRKLQRIAATPKRNIASPRPIVPRTRLAPGTRLVREWHGKTYTVEVTEDDFVFENSHYSSLSQIARFVTGARWSGPRFFGL